MLTLSTSLLIAQSITVIEKHELPGKVKETSGMIYFDGHLITHNDSGDDPLLYEIDTTNGEVIREIELANASNNDWEDIAQDDQFIYIGDFGNNEGDRNDLKIYKLSKSTFLNNDVVGANAILFQYEDQIDFTENHHNTNFDAEAMIIKGDSILIFTKNWVNRQTHVYYIPNQIGSFSAKKIDTYDSDGLVTGADLNDENELVLCGYDETLSPFIIHSTGFKDGLLFNGEVNKVNITDQIGPGSQTEAICFVSGDHYFLSREKFEKTISGIDFTFKQTLYDVQIDITLNQAQVQGYSQYINFYPNPVKTKLYLSYDAGYNKPDSVFVTDESGQRTYVFMFNDDEIDMTHWSNGIYYLTFVYSRQSNQTIKVVKQ